MKESELLSSNYYVAANAARALHAAGILTPDHLIGTVVSWESIVSPTQNTSWGTMCVASGH
jgi:hypothetical protein